MPLWKASNNEILPVPFFRNEVLCFNSLNGSAMCRCALPLPHLYGAVCQGPEKGSPRLPDHVTKAGMCDIYTIILHCNLHKDAKSYICGFIDEFFLRILRVC
jgi:hypothetical protein